MTDSSAAFFIWHTAEDAYVPPEHTYQLARSLAARGVPHSLSPDGSVGTDPMAASDLTLQHGRRQRWSLAGSGVG